jgi:hypothetical protein
MAIGYGTDHVLWVRITDPKHVTAGTGEGVMVVDLLLVYVGSKRWISKMES